VLIILQSGFDNHPDNPNVKKMFVYAVNNFGTKVAEDDEIPRAVSIFQSAARSLPAEQTFLQNIELLKQQQ